MDPLLPSLLPKFIQHTRIDELKSIDLFWSSLELQRQIPMPVRRVGHVQIPLFKLRGCMHEDA